MANILCIDDDKGILTVLQKVLEKAGLSASTCNNPVEALGIAEKEDFDLFVIDVMMPEMTGYDLCHKLRDLEKTKDKPIIFLTGKNEISDMLQGYKEGAHVYLSKPFNSKVLLEHVLNLLKKSSGD